MDAVWGQRAQETLRCPLCPRAPSGQMLMSASTALLILLLKKIVVLRPSGRNRGTERGSNVVFPNRGTRRGSNLVFLNFEHWNNVFGNSENGSWVRLHHRLCGCVMIEIHPTCNYLVNWDPISLKY